MPARAPRRAASRPASSRLTPARPAPSRLAVGRPAPSRLAAGPLVALVGLLLLALAVAGCGATPGPSDATLAGTGDVVTELRDLGPFTRVSVGAGFKVVIGEAAAQQVSVAAQGNLLPAIETRVVDGQLIVTVASPGISSSKPMTLTLRMTRVESVALSGGAVGYLEHTGDALNLDVSGGAQLTAIGDTTDLRLVASSGSHAELGELTAQQAEIDVNDGSSVEVHVVDRVTGHAGSGATVVLTVKPAQQQIEMESGATVQGG